MTFRRTLRAALPVLTGVLLVTVPAQAETGAAMASGSAGTVTMTRNGVPVVVDPISPCATAGGQSLGNTAQVAVPDVVTFGDSASTCVVDATDRLASVEVTGRDVLFDALVAHGGPRLSLASYTVRCNASRTDSSSSLMTTGLSGVSVPEDLPANYLVTVPGADGAPPLATVTFNEKIVPIRPDGGTIVNLMHIRVFPQGGPDSGDVVVGSVHCVPAG
jgi:hypothetical protein